MFFIFSSCFQLCLGESSWNFHHLSCARVKVGRAFTRLVFLFILNFFTVPSAVPVTQGAIWVYVADSSFNFGFLFLNFHHSSSFISSARVWVFTQWGFYSSSFLSSARVWLLFYEGMPYSKVFRLVYNLYCIHKENEAKRFLAIILAIYYNFHY